MTLKELRQRLEAKGLVRGEAAPSVATALSRELSGVAYDSRQVTTGAVFVALKGLRTDGARFADQAFARGALAVVSESLPPEGLGAPWVVVSDARLALAVAAAAFYGQPSDDLVVAGVTGTNGKTTTTHLLAAVFEASGIKCGRLGTITNRIGTDERTATRTTAEAPDIQRLLREMLNQGCRTCVMEVSSHALALRRVDENRFAAAVFTNLTRDHLEFHGGMEGYFRAKQRLFEMLAPGGVGVVNIDDPRGVSLAALVERPVTYAIDRQAAIVPGPLPLTLGGLEFDVRTPRGTLRVRSQLVGRPGVYNILAAVATAVALDLPFSAIERGIASVENVPGRFEIVSGPEDAVTVVVDYAHTDDALRNLLEAARPLAVGRLITVFGCGGGRDRAKRPLMGAVAARLSDLIVITSDNPRSEDPAAIIEEIARGLAPPGRGAGDTPPHLAIVDRGKAIEQAIREARAGDVVLIAGKGHERYQIIGDREISFSDVEAAQVALTRRRTNSTVG